jgi:hypothetical protein
LLEDGEASTVFFLGQVVLVILRKEGLESLEIILRDICLLKET